MKELVAAVADSERGKGASLSALLAEHADRLAQRPSKEENKRLHERIRVMEEELRRSYLSQDLASHP